MEIQTVEFSTARILASSEIQWESYLTGNMISSKDLQLLRRYDKRAQDSKWSLLEEDGVAFVETFLVVLRKVSYQEVAQYTLALIKELLDNDPGRAALFHKTPSATQGGGQLLYEPLLQWMRADRWHIAETACTVLTAVLSARPGKDATTAALPFRSVAPSIAPSSPSSSSMPAGLPRLPSETGEPFAIEAVLAALIEWLASKLKGDTGSSTIPPVVNSLSVVLREPSCRVLFLKHEGLVNLAAHMRAKGTSSTMSSTLPLDGDAMFGSSTTSSRLDIQLLYECGLCAWLLSFESPEAFASYQHKMLKALVEVLGSVSKEKVVRVCVLTLCNIATNNAAEMVGLGLPRVLENLRLQAWDDEELVSGLEHLEEKMEEGVKSMSSFEEYFRTVQAGKLSWGTVHKDDAFWRENVLKFEQNGGLVLQELKGLLQGSTDPVTLSVACHDVGKFVQFHPSGRKIWKAIESEDDVVMRLMSHPDPDVQKHALMCVQKMLLNNWSILQLPTNEAAVHSNGATPMQA